MTVSIYGLTRRFHHRRKLAEVGRDLPVIYEAVVVKMAIPGAVWQAEVCQN